MIDDAFRQKWLELLEAEFPKYAKWMKTGHDGMTPDTIDPAVFMEYANNLVSLMAALSVTNHGREVVEI